MAIFLTWTAFLVDGNLLTNLMSIGASSIATGTPPPPPAIAGGLNAHGLFEGAPDPNYFRTFVHWHVMSPVIAGDASMTRSDIILGDSITFNQTLFDQVCILCRIMYFISYSR